PAFKLVSITQRASVGRSFGSDVNGRTSAQAGGICPPWEGWNPLSDTCFRATNMTLRELMLFAYAPWAGFRDGLASPDNQIRGGPDWMDTDRFDVAARADSDGSMEA